MKLVIEDNNAIGMTVSDPETVEVRTGDAVDVGTKSYNRLKDKPSIEGVTLQGDVSLSAIGAMPSDTTYVSTVNGQSGAVTVTEGLTPLIGDTDDIAPSEVKTALMEGRNICILRFDALDDIPLALEFTSWNSATDTVVGGYAIDVVISQTIASYNSIFYLFELVGEIAFAGSQTNQWYVLKTELAQRSDIPTSVSDLYNDEGFITTETDPTVPAWAKESSKPTYTASEVGAVPSVNAGTLYYGVVDNTSTSTVFTATIDGITEYHDGLAVMLKNGIVTSASGFTININGLGAKQAYSNMALATAETTLFNINYTMLFVYDSTRVEGGGWVMYRGYNSNDNTIGYQIRSNSMSLPMKSVVYRYRLLFTSADGEGFVPANNSTSTNATAKRTPCQDKIDPFGRIVYYGTTTSVASGSRPGAAYLWDRYTLSLGYSFNGTGSALVLTSWKPVYLKCSPQADGSAIIDSTEPYVQAKPTTNDGFIYIHLGVAYSATNIELNLDHPVYYHDGTKVRLWTGA